MNTSKLLLSLALVANILTLSLSAMDCQPERRGSRGGPMRTRRHCGVRRDPYDLRTRETGRARILQHSNKDLCKICRTTIDDSATNTNHLTKSITAPCGHQIPIHRECLDMHPQSIKCPTCHEAIPEICIICAKKFREFRGDEQRATTLPCHHNLCSHKLCLDQWVRINPSCPLCRAQVAAPAAQHQIFAPVITPNDRLLNAARSGNIAELNSAIDAGANILTAQTINGGTALHFAAYYGHHATVIELLNRLQTDQQRTELIFARNNTERVTPLHHAAFSGHNTIVTELLDRLQTDQQRTELILAQSSIGLTALHYTALSGNVATVIELLNRLQTDQQRTDLIFARNNRGVTAMHHAALFGYNAIVTELLNRLQTDQQRTDLIQTRDISSGETTLDGAALSGNVATVIELLYRLQTDRQRTELIQTRNNNGSTSLHYAAHRGYTAIVTELLHRLPDQQRAELIQTKNNDGDTALHFAVEWGHNATVTELLNRLHTDQQRTELILAQNNRGETALHLAAQFGQNEIVQILLAHGADSTIQNNDHQTPAAVAREKGHSALADMLDQRAAQWRIDHPAVPAEEPMHQ